MSNTVISLGSIVCFSMNLRLATSGAGRTSCHERAAVLPWQHAEVSPGDDGNEYHSRMSRIKLR